MTDKRASFDDAFDPVYGLPRDSVSEWLARNPQLLLRYEVEEWLVHNPPLWEEYQAAVRQANWTLRIVHGPSKDKMYLQPRHGDSLSQLTGSFGLRPGA